MTDDLFDNQLDAGPSNPTGTPLDWEAAATIEIRRPPDWFGTRRVYEIQIDGHTVARLGRSGPVTQQVRPGWHSILAKMERAPSETLWVYLADGDQCRFSCDVTETVRRCWNTVIGSLAVLLLIWIPSHHFGNSNPNWKGSTGWLLSEYLSMLLIAVLVPSLLFMFSKMMPWNPPGSFLMLIQIEAEPPKFAECSISNR